MFTKYYWIWIAVPQVGEFMACKLYLSKVVLKSQEQKISLDTSGVSNLRDLMPDDLRWSWCNDDRNKVHNKRSVLESSLNHPLTPPHGKIVIHETGPWCQKGWGPLVYTFVFIFKYHPHSLRSQCFILHNKYFFFSKCRYALGITGMTRNYLNVKEFSFLFA